MGTLTKDLPLESVDADFGDGPMVVYYRKMNLYEMDLIHAKRDSMAQTIVETLFQRARDEQGHRLWRTPADREMIERQFDSDEVIRVVGAMNGAGDAAGN